MKEAEEMPGWNDFAALDPVDKAEELLTDGNLFHILYPQQFDRDLLEELGALATRIRKIAKRDEGMRFLQGLLFNKRAMLYFTQPSTRTFLSFFSACQILGIGVGEVRDRSMSSEFKGESPEDAIRSFSSYFDMIIMRSEIGGLSERMAYIFMNSERPVPVINAGSGKDQHPTQALLDIYTLQRSFEERGGIDGKTVLFCGDLARGRTVRSLACLLTNYSVRRLIFSAPPALTIGADVLKLLDQNKVEYEVSQEFDPFIPAADAVYMTRIQDEWDSTEGESRKLDTARYVFRKKHLEALRPDAVIMHPLPRRNEIEKTVDQDSRAVYWRQMRNGMWIRAALIATIFNRSGYINEHRV